MADGCYDLNGRCVNCKKLHPCDCEIDEPLVRKAIDKLRDKFEEE